MHTILDALDQSARSTPERLAFTFVADGSAQATRTYGSLHERAGSIAVALREVCKPGDRAALLYRPGVEFVDAFFGCLYAGVIAVPLHLGASPQDVRRVSACLLNARPKVLLGSMENQAQVLSIPAAEELCVPWLGAADMLRADPSIASMEHDPAQVAFIQYTSGSTSAPKGVVLTHANIVANQRMIAEAFGHDGASIMGGWLPLYHDMGLIGNVLQSVWLSVPCFLMSPQEFIQRPLNWLKMIDRYRLTTSGAPNFAYDMCARAAARGLPPQLDLSSWQVAFNGAETVRADVMDRFERTFAPCGFRREAFFPCYGLAEATLFVSGPRLGSRTTMTVDTRQLESEGKAVVAQLSPSTRTLVSSGFAAKGLTIKVVDPATLEEMPEGLVGEIWLAGPSITETYWAVPESPQLVAGRCDKDEKRFLRTGDLGFLQRGELFITGRLKDLVIVRGRNHHPEDIEIQVQGSHAALEGCQGAAFSIDTDGSEKLIVLHEINRQFIRRVTYKDLQSAARHAVAATHGINLFDFAVVLPRSLPRTSSGKIQRHVARQLYQSAQLRVAVADTFTFPREVSSERVNV